MGRLQPSDDDQANDRKRRSAEARDSTDGVPLTVPERSFLLRPPDGKVCPKADPPLRPCNRLFMPPKPPSAAAPCNCARAESGHWPVSSSSQAKRLIARSNAQ